MEELSRLARFRTEILSGLTVSLALVPEAVAFAFVAGVHPLVGMYAAFFIGFITSLTGGRPGMISGATGALAVVMVALVKDHGVEYLFMTVILMGIIQMAVGALRLGNLIRMVSVPVMYGFVNGLAIVIFLSQLENFKIESVGGTKAWLPLNDIWLMLGLVAVTMAVIFLVPRLTSRFPAALAGILVVSVVVILGGIPTPTVGDLASISGGLPVFDVPDIPFSMETVGIILPYALILAGIGLTESLLTLSLIDGITRTTGQKNRECVAQGAANVVTGFFGGMGGCAMIGQSMINIRSGARQRTSGLVASVLLLLYILFASSLIEQIPIAALVGVMFVVVIATISWTSLRIIRRVPRSDALVMVLVTGVTVATDLATAVLVGVIVQALIFAWKTARYVYIEIADGASEHQRIYKLHGQLCFASVSTFKDLFHPDTDPPEVVVDFNHSRIWDHSGMEAIVDLARSYDRSGKQLRLMGLSDSCQEMLIKANVILAASVDDERDPEDSPSHQVMIRGLGGSSDGH